MTSEVIERQGREYSIYVNKTRAIPHAGDSFKESQRIALWVLSDIPEKIKTVSLAGRMIASELYVHGDAAAVEAIALLASPYLNNIPLIVPVSDSGFGSRIDPKATAQPRYTYVRRSKIAEELIFRDIEIVDMVPNYDGSTMMPASFLPLLPIILLNGVVGIGVGFSTNILPRSFTDIQKAVLKVLDGEKLRDHAGLVPYYHNFHHTVTKIEPGKYAITGRFVRSGANRIIIDDLPVSFSLEKFKEYLLRLIEEKKIIDYTDNSSDEIEIEVKFKPGYLASISDEDIITLLKLRSTETENIRVLDFDGSRLVYYDSPQKLVEDWVKWRLTWYSKRYERLLAVEQHSLLFWQALLICLTKGVTQTRPRSKADLKEKISQVSNNPPDDIVEKIASLPLWRFTQEGEEEAREHIEKSKYLIHEYQTILRSPKMRQEIFADEVRGLHERDYI